jgi:hypothetical protein
MTLEERKDRFFRFHGPVYREFRNSEMWEPWLDLVRAHDPAREIAGVSIEALIKADASPILLGNSRGFNTCVNVIESLAPPETADEPEATFQE